MVKNEADVIESCMRHAAKFADEILICDHMSTDRTLEILESLCDEGLPIKISKYEKNEINQDIVHDQLLSDAISSGADIIFPIDADEFPIYLGGNSNDLRKYLQNLDPNQMYWIKWIHCMLLEPEKDQDKFILNRPALRSNIISSGFDSPDSQPKIIIGVKAWIDNDLHFVEGHHAAILPSGAMFPNHVTLNEIEMFHYFCRSNAQWLSKDLTIYLTHILMYSYYNSRGSRSQLNVKNFLQGKTFVANDPKNFDNVKNPVSVDNDLASYRNEIALKYSIDGKVDPLKNIFRLACSITREKVVDKLFELKKIVRVFIFHFGNSKKTIKSIQSVIDQNYPYKKISIVLLNDSGLTEIIHGIGNSLEKISFITKENFAETLIRANGDYVQFVTAGDRLLKDKITHSVEFMNSDYNLNPDCNPYKGCGVVFMESIPRAGKFLGMKYKADSYDGVVVIDALNFFSLYLTTGRTLQDGITRGFFDQKIFSRSNLVKSWASDGKIIARQLILWAMVFDFPNVGFINEPLVDGDPEEFSQDENREFNQILAEMLEKFRGSPILSEAQYQSARKIINL